MDDQTIRNLVIAVVILAIIQLIVGIFVLLDARRILKKKDNFDDMEYIDNVLGNSNAGMGYGSLAEAEQRIKNARPNIEF